MKRRDGFTMIEVLMATAIAALLMLAVLSVTASLGQSRQVVESQTLEPSWRAQLIQTMDHDFALARRVVLHEDGGFVIEGLSYIDGSQSRGRHRPTVVRYVLIETDPGSRLLIREQTDLRDAESEEPFKTLLGMNVATLTATAFYPPPPPPPPPEGTPEDSEGAFGDFNPVLNRAAGNSDDDQETETDPAPTGVELVIVFEDDRIEPIQQRWELSRVDTIEAH